MLKAALAVLLLYFILTAAVFAVDLWYYLIDRYGRFHIGRFPSREVWKDRVIKKGLSWLKREPTVKISDNSRYLLLDMLRGKYRSGVIQSWQKGALLLGLSGYGTRFQPQLEAGVETVIGKDGNFIRKPDAVDCGLLCCALLQCGDPLAVKPAMDYAAELILNHLGEDGMLRYTNEEASTERYVDTIGLAVPFLFRYAKQYDRPDIARTAMDQLKKFTETGLYQDTCLPNHAYDTVSGLPLGVYGWGRGCAWYVIGLMDSYPFIDDPEGRAWTEDRLRRTAEAYKGYQREDGGFGQILQLRTGYDSSATAVLAWFYWECARLFGEEEYGRIADRALEKLRSVTKITGTLDLCQGDTKGIGIFSATYDIMPFAQGFLIRTLSGE